MFSSYTRSAVSPQDAANSARLDVEDRLLLEATVPWVAVPAALMVHHAGRGFEVRPRIVFAGVPHRCGFAQKSMGGLRRTVGPTTAECKQGECPYPRHPLAQHTLALIMCHGAAWPPSPTPNPQVLVDATSLPPGLHYGEVLAFEADDRGRGPLFRVPVTVVRPLQVGVLEVIWIVCLLDVIACGQGVCWMRWHMVACNVVRPAAHCCRGRPR